MATYIPAIVLQRNNSLFLNNVTAQKLAGAEVMVGLGLATEIPTPDGGAVIDADYWAEPVGEGVLTGFKMHPYNPSDPVTSVKPNAQCFAVCRIYNRLASDYWYILGTVAQYITASAGGAALPTTFTTLFAAEQKACQFDINGKYFFVLQLPTLTGNARYFPYGYLNGVALPAGANTGYATSGALLTFLNANWTNLGSPVSSIVWTLSADGLTLLGEESSGHGVDTLQAQISAINPSL